MDRKAGIIECRNIAKIKLLLFLDSVNVLFRCCSTKMCKPWVVSKDSIGYQAGSHTRRQNLTLVIILKYILLQYLAVYWCMSRVTVRRSLLIPPNKVADVEEHL